MTNTYDRDSAMGFEQGDAKCPQCKRPLDIVDRSTIIGYPCHDCGGIWLEKETMTRVQASLDPQSLQVGQIADGLAEVPFPPHDASPPCPMCGVAMATLVMAGTDVEVDQCLEHGTWLDRGELQAIVHELMSRMTESTRAAMPPGDVRDKMMALYGMDPTLKATQLPKLLEDALEIFETLVDGHVAPVPTRKSGEEND